MFDPVITSNINVLVACEESQTVAKAFRRYGFNAYSCDIQECSGNRPERVIKKVQDSIDNYVYDKLINALVKQIGGCNNEKYPKL